MAHKDDVQIGNIEDRQFNGFKRAYRPRKDGSTLVNKKTGEISYCDRHGRIVGNSALLEEEWRVIDEIVVEAAGPATEVLADLPKLTHASIGVLASSYSKRSQFTEADVSMSGRSRGSMDAPDYTLVTTPLPVIFKEIEYGERELESSRRLGSDVSTDSIFEATRVVSEKMADMFYNGFAAISFNGATIYGLTTQTAINTGTGGDWGTISNIHPNVVSMVGASKADFYRGPWTLDVADTQHTQMLARYTDGSSSTAEAEVLKIPGLESVVGSDQLTDGTAVLRQNTRNVIEWQQVNLGGQNVNGVQIALVEWMSGDGMVHHLKLMAIASPIIKSDYEGRSGIVKFTGL